MKRATMSFMRSWLAEAIKWTSQVALVVKNPPTNAGDIRDASLISGSERFPRGGNGNQLHYSCLENCMDKGVWWATVHGGAVKTRLSHVHKHHGWALNLNWKQPGKGKCTGRKRGGEKFSQCHCPQPHLLQYPHVTPATKPSLSKISVQPLSWAGPPNSTNPFHEVHYFLLRKNRHYRHFNLKNTRLFMLFKEPKPKESHPASTS